VTKTVRSRYTLEFKQEAVRLVQSGTNLAGVARSLGVVEQTVFNWVKAQREGRLGLVGADSKPVSTQEMEVNLLCFSSIASAATLPYQLCRLLEQAHLFVLPPRRPDRRVPRVVKSRAHKFPTKNASQR
jgi:transposase